MIIKFKGSVRELHQILKDLRVLGKFRKCSGKHWQYRAFTGAIVNFYPSTSRIYVQGAKGPMCDLNRLIVDYASHDIYHNYDSIWFLGPDKK